jgi:hypothetical protein
LSVGAIKTGAVEFMTNPFDVESYSVQLIYDRSVCTQAIKYGWSCVCRNRS